MKFDTRKGELIVEGSRFRYEALAGEFSMVEQDGSWSVLINGRSFRVSKSRAGEWHVNGATVEAEVFDPRGLRSRGKGSGAEGAQTIQAPMPGKVVRVLVEVGDRVEPGQGLVVVEAMKMQNEMKSPKAGRVTQVKTKADAAVAAGDVLVVVE